MKKLTTILVICGILGLAVIAVPEHLTEKSSHEECPICQFIHHTPVFQFEDFSVANSALEVGEYTSLDPPYTFSEPALRYECSRAPPKM